MTYIDNQSNNKRIVKNTFVLYIRMLLVMVITLYTSRVVLQQLGEIDYGIYSVIGGVVTLFTFFNMSMSTSTQRFITFELGKGESGQISKIFSACFQVHIWICIAIIVLAETIGLWFVNTKMNFPSESMGVVNWTYQLSVLSSIISVIRFPYNALVLAYERMNYYAYNSIVEVMLKLGIVFLLILTSSQKLIFYISLLTTVTSITTIWYIVYCRKTFPKVKLIKTGDLGLYKEIVQFSGWATFGSIANVGYQQGIAIIVNIFYGVVINAALGIANQVNSAIQQFVSGFQQALNPQLIKSQAAQSKERQISLILTSSKFSFLIMLLVIYPLIINIHFILKLWLGEYPPETGILATLIIIGALLETISGPLWVTIFAIGKIKKYQLIISLILLMNVPLAYIIGLSNLPVWQMFAVRIILFAICLLVRLFFLNKMIGFRIGLFINKVLFPLILICFILIVNIVCLKQLGFNPAINLAELCYQTTYLISITIVSILLIGLSKSEFNSIKSFFLTRWLK